MEMFELKYFLAVAQVENVNRAAGNIHVSAGSLSKTIARLEDELQTPLFFKSGRGIRLTPEGLVLKQRAFQIVQLEEDARLELTGREAGSLNVYLSSEEILQTYFGLEVVEKIGKLYPRAKTHFLIRSEAQAIDQLLNGEVHFALITQEPPAEVASKILSRVEFQTCASKHHPLIKKYGSKAIPIEEVLKHPFVLPDSTILGKIAKANSTDGWRDDKFPRQVKYKVCGLKLMEQFVHRGMALGYLPDYCVRESALVPLNVSGCPFSCLQTVRIIAKNPSALNWMSRLWNQI